MRWRTEHFIAAPTLAAQLDDKVQQLMPDYLNLGQSALSLPQSQEQVSL